MPLDNPIHQEASNHSFIHTHSTSSWSRRPGMKPSNAVAVGGITAFFALLLASIGMISLILGIVDNYSALLPIPGTVISHSSSTPTSLPHLTIGIHTLHFPSSIRTIVSSDAERTLPDNAQITLYYTPHLHTLYALGTEGKYYDIPGANKAGNPFGAGALLLIGLLLLPYPALLAQWGWRDILAERRGHRCTMTAKIISVRARTRTEGTARIPRAGLTPRGSSSTYRIRLLPVDTEDGAEELSLNVREDLFQNAHEGTTMRVIYSPHVRYIYALEAL